MRERRKYARIHTDQVISFAHLETSHQLALSRDVSSGGIRFEAVGCELELGDTIRVTFNVGERTIEAVGQVVWCTEVDPITSDIGLEFAQIDASSAALLDEIGGPEF